MSSIYQQEIKKNLNSGVIDNAKREKKKYFSFYRHVYINDYKVNSGFRLLLIAAKFNFRELQSIHSKPTSGITFFALSAFAVVYASL